MKVLKLLLAAALFTGVAVLNHAATSSETSSHQPVAQKDNAPAAAKTDAPSKAQSAAPAADCCAQGCSSCSGSSCPAVKKS